MFFSQDELFNCPDGKLYAHNSLHVYPFFNVLFTLVLSVELNFDQSVYRVSEEIDSKNLALYVCLTANNTDRQFAATLTPLSGTALG